MNTKKRSVKPKGKGRRKPRRGAFDRVDRLDVGHTVAREGLTVADETVAECKYTYITALTSGASDNASYAYNPTAPFDVDPGLGGPSATGYTNWSNFYANQRVISYTYDIEANNLETARSVIFSVYNTDTQPTLGSGAAQELAQGNRYTQSKLLGPRDSGSSTFRFRKTIHVSQLAGTASTEFDNTYASVVTSKPTDLMWLTVAAICIGANLTTGVNYYIRITMKIRFYGRVSNITFLDQLERQRVVWLAMFEYQRKKYKALGKPMDFSHPQLAPFLLMFKTLGLTMEKRLPSSSGEKNNARSSIEGSTLPVMEEEDQSEFFVSRLAGKRGEQ